MTLLDTTTEFPSTRELHPLAAMAVGMLRNNMRDIVNRIPDADTGDEVYLICFVRVTGGMDPVSCHANREAAEAAMLELGEPGPCGGEKHVIVRLPVEGGAS